MKEHLRKLFQWRRLRRWARMKAEAEIVYAGRGSWDYQPKRQRREQT